MHVAKARRAAWPTRLKESLITACHVLHDQIEDYNEGKEKNFRPARDYDAEESICSVPEVFLR